MRYLMARITVVFSSEQAGAALWTYGEDDLVPRALQLREDDLRRLWTVAGEHWRVDHGLPLSGRLVVEKVIAFACIEHFEGRLRPLARDRRRSRRAMPEQLARAEPVSPAIDVS